MEPICWTGIVGVVAVTTILLGMFKGKCSNSSSACGCDSKKDSTQVKDSRASSGEIDDQKEKAINDLIK